MSIFEFVLLLSNQRGIYKGILRILLVVILSILSHALSANMASPIRAGTWTSSPFISRNVDIVKEQIVIIPDEQFETVKFEVEYHLKVNQSGKQIPLLFYASEFKEKFKVWLDSEEIKLIQVPKAYDSLDGTALSDFKDLFESGKFDHVQRVTIEDSPSTGFVVSIDNLKFFEVDLQEGIHVIRVEYLADKWIDQSGWVKQYSFRYILSPAKYWKSFGDLEIILDESKCSKILTTNLGSTTAKDSLNSKKVWYFSALPSEVVKIYHKPKVSKTASVLLAISPNGFTLILAVILITVHLVLIRAYRKSHPQKKYSWVMIIGSIVIPFLILVGYMYSFDFIDFAIGKEASKFHGYTFIVLFLYPMVLPVYWIGMWLVDRLITKNMNKNTAY